MRRQKLVARNNAHLWLLLLVGIQHRICDTLETLWSIERATPLPTTRRQCMPPRQNKRILTARVYSWRKSDAQLIRAPIASMFLILSYYFFNAVVSFGPLTATILMLSWKCRTCESTKPSTSTYLCTPDVKLPSIRCTRVPYFEIHPISPLVKIIGQSIKLTPLLFASLNNMVHRSKIDNKNNCKLSHKKKSCCK